MLDARIISPFIMETKADWERCSAKKIKINQEKVLQHLTLEHQEITAGSTQQQTDNCLQTISL